MSKILWNSVLSTADARYATLDVANFYLVTPLHRYEYMKMVSSPSTSKSSMISIIRSIRVCMVRDKEGHLWPASIRDISE